MENEFDEVMAQRTDEELITILNSPEGDYQPDAIDAAQRILKARKLPDEKVATIKADQQQQKILADFKAGQPLEWYYKIYAFIVPRAYGSFIPEGYDRKISEWQRAKLYGFLFYGSVLLLILIVKFVFKGNL